jgi:hypothetical protein
MKTSPFSRRTCLDSYNASQGYAPAHLIATAGGMTVKLYSQKNRWKGKCIYQEANNDDNPCPAKALG